MQAIIIISLISATLIPIEKCFSWLSTKSQEINEERKQKTQNPYLSNAFLTTILIAAIQFLKGYGIPKLCQISFETPWLTSLFILLTLLGHIWTPFSKFKTNSRWLVLLWGIYTFISPNYFYIFPLILTITTLLTNTLPLSYCLTIISMLFIVGISDIPSEILLTKIGVFIIILWVVRTPLFNHIEKRSETLLKRFEMR